VLICWEHHHIPALASAFPSVPGTRDPGGVAGRSIRCRLDLHARARNKPVYAFGQVPQQLLAGDADTVIPN
jgi:hypothetical protein